MEISVLEEKVNVLMERKEIKVEILHPSAASPKRDEVRKELTTKLGVPKDRFVIEWLRAVYGAPRSRGLIYVYDTEKALKKTARLHIRVRNGLAEKKVAKPAAAAAAAAPEAAAPAAEKPAAEKKAAKPEAKKEAEAPAPAKAAPPADKKKE
jgi:ribosomal protein S24E